MTPSAWNATARTLFTMSTLLQHWMQRDHCSSQTVLNSAGVPTSNEPKLVNSSQASVLLSCGVCTPATSDLAIAAVSCMHALLYVLLGRPDAVPSATHSKRAALCRHTEYRLAHKHAVGPYATCLQVEHSALQNSKICTVSPNNHRPCASMATLAIVTISH